MTGLSVRSQSVSTLEVARILADRQASLAHEDDGARALTEPLLGFTLNGVRYALPVIDVRAVVSVPPLTQVPHAPAALAGLVPWRGSVMNLFDPGPALGAGATGGGSMIVLRHGHPLLALRVETLVGMLDLPLETGTPVLSRLVDASGERINRLDTSLLVAALLATTRFQEG